MNYVPTIPSLEVDEGTEFYFLDDRRWKGPKPALGSAKGTAQPRAVEDPMQTSIERIQARQKASTPATTQAQIDDFMKGTMQDPRYWHPEHRDDAYRDGVAKLWQISYPGHYQPGSWGRNDHP
ncbi:MAG: hypothetical protein P1V34_19135, partial [Alphaproteobacteria bacterium]|nr:hypothetical protein [Alphaproteobacteria bacterium]